ncbi:alpha/beta hydrolase [Variovorax sp. ZS18.2.2]|uniref:alpha/beta hydrolase n=1 Tax=Variovorax sp. ZS18.2.2 TaxID=2971255 RepID=UPI002151CA28|nr:alpha/beta hydrolase [Variovorax sp. ZS18.2.2]MCR6474648.1 alpha/beta hydrolase [Variovorax sp. ZS18.2.2]
MKAFHIAAAAALALLFTAHASAEEYDGVLTLHSDRTRAEAADQAVAAARAGNAYGDAASSTVAQAIAAPKDRAVVRAEAVAAAHAPGQNLRRETFPGSVIPAQALARGFERPATASLGQRNTRTE